MADETIFIGLKFNQGQPPPEKETDKTDVSKNLFQKNQAKDWKSNISSAARKYFLKITCTSHA